VRALSSYYSYKLPTSSRSFFRHTTVLPYFLHAVHPLFLLIFIFCFIYISSLFLFSPASVLCSVLSSLSLYLFQSLFFPPIVVPSVLQSFILLLPCLSSLFLSFTGYLCCNTHIPNASSNLVTQRSFPFTIIS
jgi:hypothetical protein